VGTKIHMDVEQLTRALHILTQIPADLQPGGNASVSDLQECSQIGEYLAGFGNGGNADSWIASHTNELYLEIIAHVNELKTACNEIGTRLQSSIDNYTHTDSRTSTTVRQADPASTPHGRI
jgi:hypothetical protein